MKDILIFCPSIEYGGVEKNLFIITDYLSKKIGRNEVFIISGNNNHRKKFSKNVKLYTPKKNYNNSSRLFKIIISIIIFIKNFRKKDIIILSFQANLTAILLAKIFAKKIVIRSNTAPEKFAQNLIKKFIFKFFLKFSDIIIVNSLSFKKRLKEFFNLESICIYNSLKKNNLKKKKIIFSKNKTLKIISVGRLTDQKDHLTLLKAFRLVTKKINAKLMIVGKGKNLRTLKSFVKENKLSGKVIFFGYSKNVYSLMNNSDLFVLTSKYEGLPNVLIEAQNLNLPIISSNCPTGPNEILLSGKLGELFPVGNFVNLSNKIIKFNNNKKKYFKKSILAKKFLFRFDLEENCSKYLKVIQKLSNE